LLHMNSMWLNFCIMIGKTYVYQHWNSNSRVVLNQMVEGIYYKIVTFLFPRKTFVMFLVKLHWLICLFSLQLLNWQVVLSIMAHWFMIHSKLTCNPPQVNKCKSTCHIYKSTSSSWLPTLVSQLIEWSPS